MALTHLISGSAPLFRRPHHRRRRRPRHRHRCRPHLVAILASLPSSPRCRPHLVAVLAAHLRCRPHSRRRCRPHHLSRCCQHHIMSSQFSVTKDASLFGLDVELDVYLSRLEAAKFFSQIRKDIDRNITVLKTLTPNAFGKRRTKDTFKENVEGVVNGETESRALMPLVEQLGSDDSIINILLLACFTLSKTTCKQLEKHNLTEVFAEFLTCIVDDCIVFSSMRAKFIDIIKDVCRKNNNETSNKLLGALDAEGGSQKRRRLDLRPQHTRAEQNEAESLVFDPEVLSPLEAEVQTALSSMPPNHGQRHIVYQFTAARVERVEGVLKGSPLLQAIKTSNQWRWERNREQGSDQGTDTVVALIPDSDLQDISFLIKVGYRAGCKMVEFLNFESSVPQFIS
ncbi:hypothetical protein VTI74DRAFT_9208 [Chaetomium olivicolor]